LVVATFDVVQQITAETISFNPWRVSLVVATERNIWDDFCEKKFQSLAGFLGRCDPA